MGKKTAISKYFGGQWSASCFGQMATPTSKLLR